MDHERELLMIPGPTMVSPRVLRALAKPILSHGAAEFTEAYTETLKLQKSLFMSNGTPFLLAGSGTLGMEAAAANLVEKGDKVLTIENGFFGEKWQEIVPAHGGVADRLTFEWGKAVDLGLVKERITKGGYKAVCVEHVDTSTGIANPIEEIGKLVKGTDSLYVVDSVCGLGGMPLKMDEWGIDFCLSGSQKAIGAPPGLSLFCVNEKAWKAIEARKTPIADYYTNLKRWRPIMDDPKKYFATPATGMVLGMLEAYRIIHEEGLEARWKRHALFSKAFQAGIKAMGLTSFPDEKSLAHTLSVPKLPDSIKGSDFRAAIGKFNVITAGGLGAVADKTIRVGHMGSDMVNDITATLAAMEMSLHQLGAIKEPGAGIGAAMKVFAKG